MVRRINFYGGPGAGKSTVAHTVFGRLKKSGYSVEFAKEQVKIWTYHHRVPKGWNQITILGMQLEQEFEPLSSGVNYVVSESPILMGYIYAKRLGCASKDGVLQVCRDFEREFPSLNFFLHRDSKSFSQEGRFQGIEESKQIDAQMEQLLEDEGIKYHRFRYDAVDEIETDIIKRIGRR